MTLRQTRNLTKSNAQFQRAVNRLPLGLASGRADVMRTFRNARAVFTGAGGYLGMNRDHDANRSEFARHSPRDAGADDRHARDLLRHCRFIRPMLMRTPPDPSSFRLRDPSELA